MNGNISRSYIGGGSGHYTSSSGTSTFYQTTCSTGPQNCLLTIRKPQENQNRNFNTSTRYNMNNKIPSKNPHTNNNYYYNNYNYNYNNYNLMNNYHHQHHPINVTPIVTATMIGTSNCGLNRTTSAVTTNGLINGIKNIVNGFINPKLNCDFHLDHHRHYNPKYRNNYMMDKQLQSMKNTTPDHHLKTILLDLNAATLNNCMNNNNNSNTNKNSPSSSSNSLGKQQINYQGYDQTDCSKMEKDIVAIFTSEDFPELPTPKKQTWQPKPNEKCSYFKTDNKNNTTNSCNNMNNPKTTNNIDVLGKNNVNGNGNKTKRSTTNDHRKRQESECESEDSFIVFTNESPTNYVEITSTAGITPYRPNCRQRQISECSDDSFVICFTDDAAEGVIEFSDITDESDTDDNDDDDTDDDDNDKDGDNKIKTDNSEDPSVGTSQPDSGFDDQKDKKVRFNLQPEIHIMHTWNFAYRAARKGDWENYARDRLRFKHRVENLTEILNPILDSKHRENIYRMRFCDNNEN